MSKTYKFIFYILVVLLPLSLVRSAYFLLEALANKTALPIRFWFLGLFIVFLSIVIGIMELAPFFTAFGKNVETRDAYRKSHGNMLMTGCLLMKVSAIPVFILFVWSGMAVVSTAQKAAGAISIFLSACMVPFAMLGSLFTLYFPFVGFAVFFLIFGCVWGSSIMGTFGEVAFMTCKQRKVSQCFIEILFLAFPISDVIILLIHKFPIKKKIQNVLCIMGIVIGLITSIAISNVCNANSGMNEWLNSTTEESM